MNERKDEFESIIAGKIKRLQKDIDEDLNNKRNALRLEINAIIDEIPDIKTETLTASRTRLDDLIRESFENIKAEWELKTREHFRELLEQYSQRSQSFLNELSAHLSGYLNQNINLFSEQFDLSAYTAFYIKLDKGLREVNQPLSLFDKILPLSFQLKKLRSKWQNHYNELITKNTASVIYDLTYRIQESFRKFNYDLNAKMHLILGSMENNIKEVIRNKTKTESQNEDVVNEINNRLIRVKGILS